MERNNETNSDRRRSRTCFLEAEEAHRHGAAEQQGNSFANCDRSKRVCREELRDRGRERDENWKRGRDREGRERERERSRSRSRMREDESGANYRQREEGGYESAGEREEKRRRQQRETERDAREPQQQHSYREKTRGEKPWSRDMEGRGSNSNSSSSDRDQRHVLLKSRQDQRELDRDRSRYHREKDRDRDRERERERERERDGKEVVKKCAENGGEKSGEERARTYQLEVLAQAKVKNTIAFLETGAGKTLIAVLLMKYKHQLMREQEPNHKRMLAVFLVPKVPLVYQQAEVIRQGTGFHVGHYCGEMGQDFWDARRWQREFDTKDVLVMTAQILLNILRHSIVKMEAIHLLILDECHHAVKKHPYSLVMSEFYHITPKDKRPCVFGMTASPVNLKGVSNQEDCAIKIRNLESKLDSIVCTIKDRRELEKHVPMPSETIVEYDKPALLFSLREEIKQMEATVEEAATASAKRSKWRFMGARDAGSAEELRLVYGVAERTESDGAASLVQKLRAIIYTLDDHGQWFAYQASLDYLTSLRNDERISHQLDVRFQESYLKKVCALLRCDLREGAVGSKNAVDNGGHPDVEGEKVQCPMDVEEGELPDTQVVSGGEHVDEILGAAVADGKVTPKVQSLIKILLNYQHTDDFRAIIFVERVVAAKILPKVFAELPSLKFVKCASLIGHNNNQDMRTRQMQETISRFRDGRVTLLVATSVAEEGLDIRQCNLVIRFDLAKTVLAYIQSRGRARKPGSNYILMLERGNLQHEAFLRNAKNSEETLRKEAIERTNLGEKRESQILASIDVGEGEIYQVPATGAVVSMNSAVGLVHFYCSQLPSDRYSILRPEFIMNRHEGQGATSKYSCKLQLPCNAPLETVEGPVCTSIRGAQQAVCLEACKKLHEMGAFTDMLLPDKGSGEEAVKLEGSEEGEPLPGTSRHREYYPEGVAEILKGDWIVADKDIDAKETSKVILFVYKVSCKNFGFSKDSLLTETSDFAILVGQELQEEVLTMTMDLFVARTMTTRASLLNCGTLELSLSEMSALKSFHVRLMSIVLDVDVEPATTPWDPIKAYLFVPVVDNASVDAREMVDWELVKRTIETDVWSNPLQRARPDVYLGTDERALGGDRREYGYSKLRGGLAFGQRAHPTYGIRGAVAQYDVVKATGLLSSQDIVEKECAQEVPPEGTLLMAEGFVEQDGLVGRIVTAVHSGKRFYVDSVRLDMTADSSFPQKDGYLGPLEYTSYADYYKQKYGVELVCKKQPLLRGRGVSHCKNLLSPRFETSEGGALASQEALDKTYYVMLPPELCLVHPLPGPLVRGAQRLPSVMRRVESMLLAIQLKHLIDYPIAASKVLEALTAASCQETFSYERAELLGDAYLKWVVSRRLFLKFPSKHEGQLTRMRQQTVSNSVLYQFALEKGLQSYIQADRFSPCRWAAPGVPPVFDEDAKDGDDIDKETKLANVKDLVLGTIGEEGEIVVEDLLDDLTNMEDGEIEGDSSAYRVLSSKTLADVVEAFIGIYYVEGGQDAAKHLMNWIGIPVEFEVEEGELAQAGCQVPETVLRSIDFTALEEHIGHKFRERSLLVEAITHASRPSSGVPCYQRLEFVGDAVLDHLITRFLFFSYTDLPPGRLTDLRAAAVNNENFARISVKHKFHLHLRHGSSALDTQIRNFVNDIQTELDKPGVNSFGLGDFKAPKVLGDILESIAGALFLDTLLDTEKVWEVFKPLLQPMVTPETLPMHPVRELQERCQQQAEGLEYKATRAGNVATVEVFVDGVQIGSAQNAQKKMAQKLAARNALVILKEKEEVMEKENGDANSTKSNKNGNVPFTRQALNDLCLKRQWPMPQYKCVGEGGPAHAKRFTYSVRVHTTTDGWTDDCVGEPMPSVKKAKDSAAVLLLAYLKRL